MKTDAFRRRTAIRIALVSVLLALVASPLTWFVARENAEEETVSLAMEESRRLLKEFDVLHLQGVQTSAQAQRAAEVIAGGLFDIAEIYDAQGQKLAESLTEDGEGIESFLPKHGAPRYQRSSYESLRLPDQRWVLRVFIPLHGEQGTPEASPPAITGYFEGVRVVPAWQEEQIWQDALALALIVALASLLCGAVIYPVVVHLSRDNERKAREVLDSHISMMEALGRAIAKRDSDTGAHNYRVAWLAASVAENLGIKSHAMQALIIGSFLHDVGKIGIPDAILLKPGRLDDEEMGIMRTHVDLGGEIVRDIPWLGEAAAVVTCHHEKWDGTGYPNRLVGENIPLGARIFAIADVFDALCSKRPYKEPMSLEAAMAIIEKDAGTHFDPYIVPVFLRLAPMLHDRLQGRDEEACRALLEQKILAHFGF